MGTYLSVLFSSLADIATTPLHTTVTPVYSRVSVVSGSVTMKLVGPVAIIVVVIPGKLKNVSIQLNCQVSI